MSKDGLSREHIRFEKKGNVYYITDLASSNGTEYKRQKLTPNWPSQYKLGDVLTIPGMRVQIRFEMESEVAKKPESIPKNIVDEITVEEKEVSTLVTPIHPVAVPEQDIEEEVKRRLEINKNKWEAQARKQFSEWKATMGAKVKKDLEEYSKKKKELAQTYLEDAKQEISKALLEQSQQLEKNNEEKLQLMIDEWNVQKANEYELALSDGLRDAQKREEEIIQAAKNQAQELIQQANVEAAEKLKACLAEIEDNQEEWEEWKNQQMQELTSWQESEREKLAHFWKETRQKASQMMQEASAETQNLLERHEREVRSKEIDQHQKLQLALRENELEVNRRLEEVKQQVALERNELLVAKKMLTLEQQEKEREIVQMVARAKEEADLIIKGAMRSKFMIVEDQEDQSASLEDKPVQVDYLSYSSRLFEERQSMQKEWSQILAKEFEEQKVTLTRKIELEAQERALNIIGKAQDEAALMINEAYRESGILIAEGQKHYQKLEEEKNTVIAQLSRDIENKAELYAKQLEQEEELGQLLRETQQKLRLVKSQYEELILTNTEFQKEYHQTKDKADKEVERLSQLRDSLTQEVHELNQTLLENKGKHQALVQELQEEHLQLKSVVYPLRQEQEKLSQEVQKLDSYVEELRQLKNSLVADESTLKVQVQELQNLKTNLEENTESVQAAFEQKSEEVDRLNREYSLRHDEFVRLDGDFEQKVQKLDAQLQEEHKRKVEAYQKEYTPLCNNLEKTKKELAHIIQEKELAAKKGIEDILKETRTKAQLELEQSSRKAQDIHSRAQQAEQAAKQRASQILADAEKQAYSKAEKIIADYKKENEQLIDQVELTKSEEQALRQKMEELKKEKLQEIEKQSLEHKKELHKKYQEDIVKKEKEFQKKLDEKEKAANAKAESLIKESTSLRESALKELENIQTQAEQLTQKDVERIKQELENMRLKTEEELTQRKVKELELVKKQIQDERERFDFDKKGIVKDLTFNLKNHLIPKLTPLLKDQEPNAADALFAGLGPLVGEVVFPDASDEGTRRVLIGSGKISTSVKKFWLKVSAAVIVPLAFLTHYLVFPEFYTSVKDGVVSGLTEGESASDIFMKKELEKRKDRPVFAPEQNDLFKSSFTDNILYTLHYKTTVNDETFKKNWTLELNRYLVDDLYVGENLVVKIMGTEATIHNTLFELADKIHPELAEEGIARMREAEAEQMLKLKQLLETEELFLKYWQFKGSFFHDFVLNSKN